MIVQEVIKHLEVMAPMHYSESFDNTGLLTGNLQQRVTGILVTLDALEEVVEDAISQECNMIVSFHPIIFSGLKKINGKNYVERAVIKAIKNDIAIYAIHTALDNAYQGVNNSICEVLKLKNRRILLPKDNILSKLITYVPHDDAERVRKALFDAGAGHIGYYDYCSFSTVGNGTFRGDDKSNPVVGHKGKLHTEPETMISVIVESHCRSKVVSALLAAHPYEEVAYDIIPLSNTHQYIGMGMIGELVEPMDEKLFLKEIKMRMNAKGIRHSRYLGKSISKVAVLGGSGSFAIDAAIASNADIFISSDIKYHQFYKAEDRLIIADIGHYESEQFIKSFIVEYLTKKIPNFAIVLSQINTNPINYL